MANQLIIKGSMKITGEVVSPNVQNTAYTLPSTIGAEGEVLKVVNGVLAWSNTGTDNDGIVGPITYTYSSTTPVTIFTAPAGTMIADVTVEIVTPFDSPSATVVLGDSVNSDILLTADETDLAANAGQIFSVQPSYVYASETAVILNINASGSTQGSFKITLSYIQ